MIERLLDRAESNETGALLLAQSGRPGMSCSRAAVKGIADIKGALIHAS